MSRTKVSKSQLLTCQVNDQWMALPVEFLSEVVTPQPRTEVPLALDSVNGLINLRGKILTELDMREILKLPPRENADQYRTIILECGDGEGYGLTVDSVSEVIDTKAENFESTPDSLSECWKGVCHGVLKQDNRILIMLDVEKVIASSMP